MSNFKTLTPHTAGYSLVAPTGYDAGTEDDLVAITALAYLNDLRAKNSNVIIKHNDYFWINYDGTGNDVTTYTLGLFKVVQTGVAPADNYSLVAFP